MAISNGDASNVSNAQNVTGQLSQADDKDDCENTVDKAEGEPVFTAAGVACNDRSTDAHDDDRICQ